MAGLAALQAGAFAGWSLDSILRRALDRMLKDKERRLIRRAPAPPSTHKRACAGIGRFSAILTSTTISGSGRTTPSTVQSAQVGGAAGRWWAPHQTGSAYLAVVLQLLKRCQTMPSPVVLHDPLERLRVQGFGVEQLLCGLSPKQRAQDAVMPKQ